MSSATQLEKSKHSTSYRGGSFARRRVKHAIVRTWPQYADQYQAPWRWHKVSALRRSLHDLLASFNLKLRTPNLDAVGLRAGHPGLCTLTDLLRLELRQ